MADMRATGERDAALPCVAWEEISEPGAYVDVTTGNLYRISPEALDRGIAAPAPEAGAPNPHLVQVSRDPSIFPLGARILCARHHIAHNF